MRIPKSITPGDTVALIAPASPLPDQSLVPECVAAMEALGVKVKQYPTLKYREDYLAGTGAQRAEDIMKAMTDPEVAAVLCLRGGFGTAHVLPYLDWKLLGESGKIFSGFSDLTALMTPLAELSGMASLHAPTSSFFRKDQPGKEVSHKALARFLFQGWESVSYRELCGEAFSPRMMHPGTARGRILGGNAAVFASLIGTSWIAGDEPVILFLEDIGEKPYRLDRYVTQIVQSPLVNRITGVVLGQFTDCEPGAEDRDDAMVVLERLLAPLKVPVLAGLPIGHDYPSFPLPIGVNAVIDGRAEDLVLGSSL